MTNFSTFLQISCSNFKLNLCQRPRLEKIVKEIRFEGLWSELEARIFPETVIHQIFEASSCFRVR